MSNGGWRRPCISSGLVVIEQVFDGELIGIEFGDIAIGNQVEAISLGSAYGWAVAGCAR